MPLAHGLEIAGYQDIGNGSFQIGDLVATPFKDSLEWGHGRIEGSLHNPEETRRVAKLAIATLQEVAEDERAYTTCTDGRVRWVFLTNRLITVREQLVADNLGTGFMMAESLGEEYYPDPTIALDKRMETVGGNLEDKGEKLSTHEDCGGWAGFPVLMRNAVTFSKVGGFLSRTQQVLGEEFNPDIYFDLASRLEQHLASEPYERYGADMSWRLIRGRGDLEAVSTLHNTGPYGVHGHQERVCIWLGESITGLALNQRLLSEVGGGTEDAQAFGINQSRMRRIATIIGRGEPDLVAKAMHAGVMATNAGHGTLAVNLPSFHVERVK